MVQARIYFGESTTIAAAPIKRASALPRVPLQRSLPLYEELSYPGPLPVRVYRGLPTYSPSGETSYLHEPAEADVAKLKSLLEAFPYPGLLQHLADQGWTMRFIRDGGYLEPSRRNHEFIDVRIPESAAQTPARPKEPDTGGGRKDSRAKTVLTNFLIRGGEWLGLSPRNQEFGNEPIPKRKNLQDVLIPALTDAIDMSGGKKRGPWMAVLMNSPWENISDGEDFRNAYDKDVESMQPYKEHLAKALQQLTAPRRMVFLKRAGVLLGLPFDNTHDKLFNYYRFQNVDTYLQQHFSQYLRPSRTD